MIQELERSQIIRYNSQSDSSSSATDSSSGSESVISIRLESTAEHKNMNQIKEDSALELIKDTEKQLTFHTPQDIKSISESESESTLRTMYSSGEGMIKGAFEYVSKRSHHHHERKSSIVSSEISEARSVRTMTSLRHQTSDIDGTTVYSEEQSIHHEKMESKRVVSTGEVDVKQEVSQVKEVSSVKHHEKRSLGMLEFLV